ncbi:MFS transporter [Planctomycetota bacterium]
MRYNLSKLIKTRLAVMMFVQYVVMGATWPIMSLYLKDNLGFSGAQAGVVLAMSAVAAFIAPVVSACVADRLMSAERLLSVCHFGAAALMTLICFQTEHLPIALLYLAYNLAMGPTIPLTNAIVFHNHPEGNKGFGNIRVWGTIGWIVVAWCFGYLWLHGSGTETVASRLPDALKLSALTSLILALYGLTLPNPHQRQEGPIHMIPMDSLRIFAHPQILLIGVVSLLIGIADRYYYFGMGPFLREVGFSDAAIMPVMSIGQMSEVFAMFGLALILKHVGYKRVLLLGILAEVCRFTVYAIGYAKLLIVAAIPCHGLAYTLFFTAVYIYIDGHTDRGSRAGLHLLFSIITAGLGSLAGNLLGGVSLDRFVIHAAVGSFRGFWLVPLVISLVGFSLIAILFRKDSEDEQQLE